MKAIKTVGVLFTLICYSLFLLQSFAATDNPSTATKPVIVIIIDDVGHNLRKGRELIDLNGQITLSILPFSPHGKTIAHLAHNQGKEVILHSPMAPLNHTSPPDGLTLDMDKARFVRLLNQQINDIPNVSGINNHMGSALTRNVIAMSWVMQELKKRDLYFIDSRTTAESIAWHTALHYRVPSWKRDVFLDNQRDVSAINKQLNKLVKKAKEKGIAFGIGHPYDETITALKGFLNSQAAHNIEIRSPSQLDSWIKVKYASNNLE
ncbi:divergent polysaccharide deacetylase family protein [Sessilibacter corallicola]|uniref:Divergent polysaccharide deacetylase family protein n=1 Tax=Sessilibacter corallicola TaxID=2904075 RepID=A0ABQ0A5S9_9GAMM